MFYLSGNVRFKPRSEPITEQQLSGWKHSGVINKAEFKRRAKTRADRAVSKPKSNLVEIEIIEHAIERLTQRTVKFIRWLKNHLDLERDWSQAMARLTEVYARLPSHPASQLGWTSVTGSP